METKYKHKSVLLIDDVDLDNFVSETVIRAYHFAEITCVHNTGESALQFLKGIGTITASQFPEVIFIDINMPVMDGFQFLEIFKSELKNEISAFKPKIVMLTSSVYFSDLQTARKRFEDIIFVVKPLTEETLKLI